MRLNLPGWYGIGSGLSAAPIQDLRRAYAEWPLFNAMLDNAEMSLAKTDRPIAERYLALGGREDLASMVLAEYELTKRKVLEVTGHRRLLEDRRVLSWAIELRNPYVDALSHLQLRALRAMRHPKTSRPDRALAERVFQLTVNGVAARGGSIDGPGAVVVGGTVYVNSGYSFFGTLPGNVLLAYSVDGR